MNLNYPNRQPIEQSSLPPAHAPQQLLPLGPRIERCEFENLLQRAMEILNARVNRSPSPRP